MFKDFNDCLNYHNMNDGSLVFKEILDNPEIIGMDKTFLDNKSPAHRADLILGEYLFKLSKHLGVVGSRLLKRGQWGHEVPDWFDHRHHMMNPEEESKNSWLESISLVLRVLPEHGRILNYCAGEAYLDYQFFRRMASEITCVDIDNSSEYKNYLIKKHSNTPKIEYLYEDILKHQPKGDHYDVVIMRSAIEHFSREDQVSLFNKIKHALNRTGWFCGDTPANPERDSAKQHSAHEYEWKDVDEAKDVLNEHFDEVSVYSVHCNIDPRETIFWKCR